MNVGSKQRRNLFTMLHGTGEQQITKVENNEGTNAFQAETISTQHDDMRKNNKHGIWAKRIIRGIIWNKRLGELLVRKLGK